MQGSTPVECEVLNVIQGAGIWPDCDDKTQLLQAIETLIAGGASGGGGSVYDQTSMVMTTTAQIPTDDTVPQISEGMEVFSSSFTPSKVGAVVMIDAVVNCSSQNGGQTTAALFESASSEALATFSHHYEQSQNFYQVVVKYAYVATDTEEKTFSVRIGNNSVNNDVLYVNGWDGAFVPPLTSVLEIREVA